jgi:hypothetical protein
MQHHSTAIEGSSWQRPWRTPAGVFLIAWIVLCLPWLSGIKTIPFDAVQQFFPAVSFSAEQLRHLQAPWWNPYLYGGYPQVADPQMMTLQPTMLLPMLLAPGSLHLFTVVVLLHVLAGGLGALRLSRVQGMPPPAQLLFALTLMFGGVAASRLQHTPMIISYCLLPWLWLGLEQVRRRGRMRDILLAGVAGGMCALQLTQVTYFIILACVIYAVAAVVLAQGQRMRLLWQLGVVAILAGGVSAPQWLSTLAWLDQTNRNGLTLEAALPGAIHWQTLVTLLSGNVFSQGRGDSWAFGDISADYLYVGAVPLALWLLWGGEVLRRKPAATRVALCALTLAIMVAVGGATPLFPWLFGWLPGLDLFRRPSDALFLTVPAAAWLGASALQVALQRQPLRLHRVSVAVVAVLGACAAWLAIDHGHPLAFAWLAVSAALGVAAVWVLRRHQSPARWVLALVLLDLLLFNVGTRFNAGSGTKSVLTADRAGPAQRAYALLAAERHIGIPERAVVFGIGGLTNGAAVHAIALANGYNPLLASDYLQMTGMPGEPVDTFQQKVPTAWMPDTAAPLYDLLGVRWLLAQEPFPGSSAQGDQVELARRDSVLPRVLNPRQVRRHEELLPPAPLFNQTDFNRQLWLPAAASSHCAEQDAGEATVQVLHYQPGRIELTVVADDAAWVVINETTGRGWQAQLEDGQVLPLLRGNGLFHALCVPAGQHQVRLRYSALQLWREGLGARLRRDGDR